MLQMREGSELMNCAACFEDVSSQWSCGVTTEPETNNYVTVNNTEGYLVVLLPCRYYSAQIIQLNRGVHLVALIIFLNKKSGITP